jgi:hypothetical protein
VNERLEAITSLRRMSERPAGTSESAGEVFVNEQRE